MATSKEPPKDTVVRKGPGTVRWHVEKAAKTVAAIVREKRDERKDRD